MNYGSKELVDSVDTILMGGRSYRELLNMDSADSYKEQTIYVVSRHDWDEKENVRFITDNIIERISALRSEPGKDIWLFGGGELTAMLLEAGLVDEMRIFYVPTILGKGISLFPEQPTLSKWTLTDSKTYENGVLGITYQKK